MDSDIRQYISKFTTIKYLYMENVKAEALYSLDFLNNMPNLENVSFENTYLRPGMLKGLNLKSL